MEHKKVANQNNQCDTIKGAAAPFYNSILSYPYLLSYPIHFQQVTHEKTIQSRPIAQTPTKTTYNLWQKYRFKIQ